MTPWIRDGYDPDGGRWQGREPMMTPKQFLSAIVIGACVSLGAVLFVLRVGYLFCADLAQACEGW